MRNTVNREFVLKFLGDTVFELGKINLDDLIENGFEGNTNREIIGDWVNYQYSASSNQILAELFEFLTQDKVLVVGAPSQLSKCPCCGLKTLNEPNDFDICRWCGWEDDGILEPSQLSSINGGKSILDFRMQLRLEGRLTPVGRWLNGFDAD